MLRAISTRPHRLVLLSLLLLVLVTGGTFGDDPATPVESQSAGLLESPAVEVPPDAEPPAETHSTEAQPAEADALGTPEVTGPEPVSKAMERWLESVDLLITAAERRLFNSLEKEYQREAFIQQFWKVRDPFPRTPRNELKERWPYREAEARSRFEDLSDHRARIYQVHGPRTRGFEVRCTAKRATAEVWLYQGTDLTDLNIVVVFFRNTPRDHMQIWDPRRSQFGLDNVISRARGCINGQQLVQVVGLIQSDLDRYITDFGRLLAKPRPRSQEWVHTFVAHSTEVPEGALPLSAQLEVAFPGRHQNRTVVQGFLSVPLEEIEVGEFAGYRSHDLLLTGEVLKDDSLFENFRYKFGFPEQPAPGQIPLSFQRYLRPGDYSIILKLEDLNGERVYQERRPLTVPQVEEIFELPTFSDPRTEQLFAEATAALEAGETSIRLVPPGGELYTGFVRIDSLVSGDQIDKVRFYLDDKHVLTKNRPPYNVELDLGSYPDLHTVRAEALNSAGEEVASDEAILNGGGYRFAVNLVEPRKGKRYANSLQARAEVEIPEGRTVERLELYLNEALVATLYQEPYIHPIVLPKGEPVAYVRAVAYLPDGNSTEDLVFINAPDYLDELEIQFVELYTTVLDSSGRPVEGIRKDELDVEEDGVKQEIVRFEQVTDLPIHVGILLDNSASMRGTLGEVRKAALSFFEQAITPRDRAAIITFNSFPNLAVELTNDRAALGSGLAGLVARRANGAL